MFLLDVIWEPTPKPTPIPEEVEPSILEMLSKPELLSALLGVAVAVIIILVILLIKKR